MKLSIFFSLMIISTWGSLSRLYAESYNLDQIIKIAQEKNLDSKEKSEEVLQARYQVQNQIGQILPSLHLGQIVSILQVEMIDLISSFLGFLYPSNWFQWKEKKYLYQAERYSYKSMIANQISHVIGLSYQVDTLREALDIYYKYRDNISHFVEMNRERFDIGEIPLSDLKPLEIFEIRIHQDIDHLEYTYNISKQLLYSVLNLDIPYEKFNLEPLPLEQGSEDDTDNILSLERIQSSIKRSPEMRSLYYMIKGAKARSTSSYFDFLSLKGNQSNAFGYGYLSHINIARSSQKVLKIRKKRSALQLEKALRQADSDYKLRKHLIKDNKKSYELALEWESVLKDLLKGGQSYVPEEFLSALKTQVELSSNMMRNKYLMTQSIWQLKRLEMRGEFSQYAYIRKK
ncbi:MAG: TolC family protein [Oligoflexales bacterium]